MATADLKVDVEFFSELYDDCQGWLTLWKETGTRWYELPSLPDACEPDDYFGVGVRRARLPGRKRGSSDDVIQVPCLWCDFDCDAPGKKKRHPSRELAEHIIGELPLRPSTIVWSGGGFHLYWLLHEPLAGDEAAETAQSWQMWIKNKPLRDYDLDSTFDLARVLRVPGSVNTRYGDARRVEVVDRSGKRYSLDHFENFVVGANEAIKNVANDTYKVSADVLIARDINPPFEKLEALVINSPEFKRVWNHKKELPSASEYDLAIASHAAAALWNDQEIAALLVVHRRKHYPESLAKVTERRDYIERTISKARGESTYDVSIRSLNGALDEKSEPERAPAGAAPVDTRQGILDRLSNVFGVKVSRWIQHGEENAIYYLELADGRRIRIGGAGAVLASDGAMRRAIYEATRIHMKHVKAAAWSGVVEALAEIVEVQPQEEAGHVEAMLGMLQQYLQQRGAIDAEGKVVAVARRRPFIEDDQIHVNMEDFRKWIGTVSRDRVTRGDILAVLRIAGWEPCFVRARPAAPARYWKTVITEEIGNLVGLSGNVDD